ncbi:MAG TPA: MmgE/PrpD family protein [Ideonella sp.]|uniref:MmgE/PrpD family protein n=1 Tax=Ideonella sp. TaxID=1929293 RepID=UPI002BA8DE0A|nr:MmgE/PrpD family protein [Ideonella sp.]HSI47102.1 MmgE/PrpD family protein [Ideonella sp.]
MTQDICHDFARASADTRFEDLPPAAVESARNSVLDTVGVTLAASGLEPAVRNFVDVVTECGGRRESTVLGFGDRLPAPLAALANGAMAHCLDFDDQTPWGAHAASSIVPAAFAVAERIGGVSGRKMLAAVAVGQDLFARLRCNVGWRKDWNLSTSVGIFSAAAAASHVLGLDARQTAHALGIASMQSSGTMELIFGTGSDLRGMYAGFTAQGAVLGALLAQRGITGIDTLFEGRAGIFNTYYGGHYDRAAMLHGLGTDYLGAGTLYKAWPAVGNVHTYLHATLVLMKEHRLANDDIEQVLVSVGDFQKIMSSPLEQRRAPATLVDAKFSLPFCVGLALARGRVKVSDFSAATLKDPQVLAAAAKVLPVDDSRFDWNTTLPDGRVEIVTRDGRHLVRVGDKVPGSAEAPMTWDDLAEKFRDCAGAATAPVSAERVERALQLARDFEHLEDVSELFRTLA